MNFLKTEAGKLELVKARAGKAESEVAKQVAKTCGVVAGVNLATDNCYAMMEQLKVCSLKKSEDELLAINKELKEVKIHKKDLSQSEVSTAADKVTTATDSRHCY